jgi:tRNA/rRNA methyltransferase
MAGTNTATPPDWRPDGPAFVFVRPQLGENIGAAARAMWNFGLRGMRLVSPRDGWPNPKAVAMASGAGGLLDEARLFEATQAAIADCAWVYATTARPREMTKPVLTPREAAADMAMRIAGGQRVGVLFGAERTGLETEDVSLANVIVTVPTNPAFASINLAQSALLMGYEWRTQTAGPPPPPSAEMATSGEVGMMLDHLEAELETAGYFYPEPKREALGLSLRAMFRRSPLTEQDVRTLRGVIRALAEGPKRQRRGGAAATLDPASCADMQALRVNIDALDRALIGLFARREAHIARAAEIKRVVGLPARIPDRVEDVLAKLRAGARAEGVDPDFYAGFWRTLIERAIAFEEEALRE